MFLGPVGFGVFFRRVTVREGTFLTLDPPDQRESLYDIGLAGHLGGGITIPIDQVDLSLEFRLRITIATGDGLGGSVPFGLSVAF
jgi:hypothetical protein